MSRHPDNTVLRRYVDEPDALLSYEKSHLLECLRCRRALEQLRENAAGAALLLALDDASPNLGAARASIFERAAAFDAVVSLDERAASSATSWRWLSVAAAAVAVLAFTYAPFRAYAQSVLTIFQPRELAPISMTRADVAQLRDVPKLEEVGVVSVSGSKKAVHFTSIAAAQRFAHETILHPSYLPSTLGRASDVQVSPPQSIRFTFDARKAKASAARKHEAIPPAPAGVDGSTLTAQIAPFVVQSYGTDLSTLHREHDYDERGFPRNAVVIAQGRVPAVRSNGVRADEIESYLISLPNVPEDVKSQIRAMRNPSDTIPVPVAIDKTSAQEVTIHGARGLLIGDNTGVGSVVVWLANGTFYSVAGGLTADEITKVANSLTP